MVVKHLKAHVCLDPTEMSSTEHQEYFLPSAYK